MQDDGYSLNTVTAAVAGDKEAFLNAFNSAIANKVTDALEIKKVEIATSLLGNEESNESEGNEAIVAGAETDDVDATSEPTTEE